MERDAFEKFGLAPGVEAVTSGAPRSEEPVHTRGYRVIAFVVASALFMQQLDGTVLTVALPTMARDLATSASLNASSPPNAQTTSAIQDMCKRDRIRL